MKAPLRKSLSGADVLCKVITAFIMYFNNYRKTNIIASFYNQNSVINIACARFYCVLFVIVVLLYGPCNFYSDLK